MASGVFDDALIKHLGRTDEFRAIFSETSEWTNRAMQKEKVYAALPVAELAAAPDPSTFPGRGPEIVDEVLARQRTPGWMD